MDLAALQVFKAVADCGGINRAAARLNRVQSNVTTRVKQLEERLGIPLFHRRNRKLVLSEEGKVLLDYAERLLRLSAEAHAAVRGRVTPQGALRLGSLESTAATRLPPLLARYHAAHPEVALELITGTTGALVERVLSEEIEAAFVAEPFTEHGLDRRLAFTEELVLVASPGTSAHGSPQAFAHVPVLAFAAGCSYRRRLEAWLAREGIAPNRIMEYGSYHAIVACAVAGAGIAVVPRSVLQVLKVGRRLQAHRLPRDIAIARTFLVWRKGHRSGALDALKESLAA